MAGRGATTFQKRQKELQRKERQQEKFAKRMERKKQTDGGLPEIAEPEPIEELTGAGPQNHATLETEV